MKIARKWKDSGMIRDYRKWKWKTVSNVVCVCLRKWKCETNNVHIFQTLPRLFCPHFNFLRLTFSRLVSIIWFQICGSQWRSLVNNSQRQFLMIAWHSNFIPRTDRWTIIHLLAKPLISTWLKTLWRHPSILQSPTITAKTLFLLWFR